LAQALETSAERAMIVIRFVVEWKNENGLWLAFGTPAKLAEELYDDQSALIRAGHRRTRIRCLRLDMKTEEY
jgi:hypothetical protein